MFLQKQLQEEILRLEHRYDSLSKILRELEQQRDSRHRYGEKLRSGALIQQTLSERDKTERDLSECENRLRRLKQAQQSPNNAVLISHRGKHNAWVETLSRNLQDLGYHGFLDARDLPPGCRKIILVASPEAIDSGWVREEYDALCRRQRMDNHLVFIPVVYGSSPDQPFLSSIASVNFSTGEYRQAFYRLVACLEGDNAVVDCDAPLEEPAGLPVPPEISSGVRAFIGQLFEQFNQNCPPPLLLLAQMDYNQAPMVEALLSQARSRYRAERCLHIAPSFSNETDTANYFAALGEQCGLSEPAHSSLDFERVLASALQHSGAPLFMLVSRFEHGVENLRQQLAGILRGLHESYPNQLHIMLCGGEKLAELKYLQGSLSLLNTAEVHHWPELDKEDAIAMQQSCCPGLGLDEATAKALLEISGGHPALLHACLLLYRQHPELPWPNYPPLLSEEPFVWQLFTPYTKNPEEAKRVREWLDKEEIAPARPFLLDSLLRRMYWKNLLMEKQADGRRYLTWRCEALRLAGQEILGK
jgi:hypothetical protein